MKKLYIVANWKSHKTTLEAREWLKSFANSKWQMANREKEIVVCAPFTLLSIMGDEIEQRNLPIVLGAQNVSLFTEGAYTGEISITQAAEFVSYVLVGHSERRKYFHETNDDVIKKLQRVLDAKLTPILCISDMEQLDYYLLKDKIVVEQADNIIFVYEPPSAISGGGAYRPESPEMVNQNIQAISQKVGKRVTTLYGGSINPENAKSFFLLEHIDGGLVGQASLDAPTFATLIQNA